MVTLDDNNITFSKYVRFLKNKDSVIIINGYSGIWGMIDSSILDEINQCINNKVSPYDYINSIKEKTHKIKLREIFEVLIEEKMIKKLDDDEITISIKDIEFKLTNKCNLRCLHCAEGSDIGKENELNTEEVKKILNKIFKMNIENLVLTGGEPLIRNDIKLLLPYIRDNFKGTVNLMTNGILIDREMASILKKCVNAVSISIDGYDEKSTEFIRGKGVYKKIIQAVNCLKEVGFNKDTLSLSMTSTKQNFNHDDDFYALCRRLDVTGIVREFSALGRGFVNYKNIGFKDYSSFNSISNEDLEDIRENLECKIFCRAGISKININQFGDIQPCLLMGSEKYKFGNMLTEDPEEIFDSEKYIKFINDKIRISIVDYKSKCKECTVRYFCMGNCLEINKSLYKNKEICEEHCKNMHSYLTKVVWNE